MRTIFNKELNKELYKCMKEDDKLLALSLCYAHNLIPNDYVVNSVEFYIDILQTEKVAVICFWGFNYKWGGDNYGINIYIDKEGA